MSLADPLRITRRFVVLLERLQVPYMIGGSWASSLHGIPRATQDVDIIIDIDTKQLVRLCALCAQDFFVDEQMAIEAVKSGGSFNIIDREELFKIDVFIQGNDELTRQEMGRRIEYFLSENDDERLVVCSAEDIIIHKLLWYKRGGGVSERQWQDVRNVWKVAKIPHRPLLPGIHRRSMGHCGFVGKYYLRHIVTRAGQ